MWYSSLHSLKSNKAQYSNKLGLLHSYFVLKNKAASSARFIKWRHCFFRVEVIFWISYPFPLTCATTKPNFSTTVKEKRKRNRPPRPTRVALNIRSTYFYPLHRVRQEVLVLEEQRQTKNKAKKWLKQIVAWWWTG